MATFIHTSSAGEGDNTTIYCTIDVESAGSSSSSTTYRFTLEDARQLTGQLEKLIFDALIENDPHEQAAIMDEHFEQQLENHELFFADEPF